MNMNFRKNLLALSLFAVQNLFAQDPHFTQFDAAPFTVNPAYTGVFNGKARFMMNYRQQWANLVDPFTTTVVAGDFKFRDQALVGGQNPINLGIQLMQDQSMGGAFKSNYLGVMASYHVVLNEADDQSIGAGLSFNYGNRRIDFADISFDRQFTSGGFDLSLPNGEAAMQNMKPFYSVGAGLLFRSGNPLSGTFIDIGFSGYHFNKPIQTVFDDPNQTLPIRWSGQMTFQQYLSDVSLINFKALYQNQAQTKYLLAGISLARVMGDEDQHMLGLGLWYRSRESFAPNVYFEFNQMRVGFSYDINYKNLSKAITPASSFELSFQWRIGSVLLGKD